MTSSRWWITGSVGAGLLALALAAASCHKHTTTTGPSADEQAQENAKEYFVASVYPRIAGQDACGQCHSGPPSPCADSSCIFIGTDGPTTYMLIEKTTGLIAAPTKSPLLNYQHTDKTIRATADQSNVLGIWLGMEADARHLPGAVPKASTITDAYTQFGNCMNYDVFTGTGMADLAYVETDSYGPCLGCHSGGQGSLWLSADPRSTFEQMRRFPYIQKFVVGKLDTNGEFVELVPSERLLEKANEACPEGATGCHPQFGLPGPTQNALDLFVRLTLQNLQADSCDNGIVSAPDAGPLNGDGGEAGK